MILDDIAPEYDKREIHEITVHAPAETVYDAIWRLDMGGSWIVSLLFRLRRLPPGSLTLQGLVDLGFNVLADDRPREVVLGLAGRFWTPAPELGEYDAASFRAFEEPGNAKASWNFLIEPIDGEAVRLRTETRIRCTDERSRRRFALYWFFIRPFSGWIRRVMLRLIRDDAETLFKNTR